MSKLDLCRACLSNDNLMSPLTSTRYKEIYEKHTGTKLITGHGRPDKVCNSCNLQLQSFHKFLQMAKKTEKYLSDTYKSGVELLQQKLSELARELESIPETTSDTATFDEDMEATTAWGNETQDVDVDVTSARSNETQDVDVEVTTARSNETQNVDDVVKVTKTQSVTQDVAIKIEALDYEEEIDLAENTDAEEPEILSVDNFAFKIQNPSSSMQRTFILKDHNYSKHALEIEYEPPIEDKDTWKDSEEDCTIVEYNLPSVSVQLERLPISKHQLRSLKKTSKPKTKTLEVTKKPKIPKTKTPEVIKKISKLKNKTPEANELHYCQECDYKCQFKSIMEKHIKIHKSSSKTRTRTVGILKSRERSALLKRGECDTCGKIFSKPNFLLRHKKLHTTKYSCEMCDRQFHHKSTFLVHTRTHTGEKPFGCKYCEKTFNDKSNCRKHMKTHMGTAGHACIMCGKVFSKRNRLKEHVIEHIL